MFIVTGASGQLGRLVVERMLKDIPATQIGVSVRDPEAVEGFKTAGVRVRQGDFAQPESLAHAFEGATNVLIVSSNAAASGGDTLAQHRNAIAAAKAAGAKRVLYTSQMASSANSHFPPARDHAATEQLLAESGMAWTALRHGFYAQSGHMMNAQGIKSGNLAAPEDGQVAWTTHQDLAEADAAFLAGKIVVEGPTPPLTGGRTLDMSDLAKIAADHLGRPVSRTIIGDQEMEAKARDRGLPPTVIAITSGYFAAARAGEFAKTDPMLERVLGRAPISMESYLAKALENAYSDVGQPRHL